MKNLNILKGISWVVGKMGFMKKCGDTITAFLETLEDFEVQCKCIWEKNEKNIKNSNISDSSDTVVDVGANS
jgi:hypothetical protein